MKRSQKFLLVVNNRYSLYFFSRAGEIVRAIWSGGDLGIVEKTGKDDLQTQADR